MEKITLTQLLKSNNFYFKKKFGQNFITDTGLLLDIAQKAGVNNTHTVLEIGAGGGTLTRALSSMANKVIAFEIDNSLQPILQEMLSGCDNIQIIYQDFMRYNLQHLEEQLGDSYIVVANLPYYITTPIIMRFVEEAKNYQKIVIMVQEEVAKRLIAQENTAEYGAITAILGLNHDMRIIKKVGRKCFYPVPDVDSAVLEITKRPNEKYQCLNQDMYKKTVKHAFLNRRKTLENNLISGFNLTRAQAQQAIANCGFSAQIRGETLSVGDFVQLSNYLYTNKF